MEQLAPSGVDPHNHRVEVDNSGQLVLYWTHNRQDYVRVFTNEETRNLLAILSRHKEKIG